MEELVEWLKKMLRIKSSTADEELEIAGIQGKLTDPLYKQAVKLYVKANYGYDDDSEKFLYAFQSLRDSMALSGEYKEK